MATSNAMNTSNDRVKYTISITQNSQSIQNNTSNVTVNVRFYRTNTGYTTYGTGTVYCKINGTTYSASVTPSQRITNAGIVLFSKNLNISHNTDGTKTLTCSAWINLDTPLTSSEQSYSQVLTTIPRYAKIVTFTVGKIDETSLKVTWGCDAACDKIYYSLNGGGFIETGGYPNFVINGLTANTTYSVKIRVRRKDSQLITDSSPYVQSTYNYPHCTNSPDFTIGKKNTLTIYNPLGRSCSIWIEAANGSQKGGDVISGTSISGYNNSEWQQWFYSSIPNSTSGQYKVLVKYGTVTMTRNNGNTYQITGNEIPTVNGITYKDIDSSVVAITGNNQQIVQNKSNLQVNYEQATPNYSAGSITKYSFELNGVIKESTAAGGSVTFGTIDSANDLTLTLTVTDSRGLTATKSITITMLAHSNPTANVVLERLNNYEDEVYLTVDASISSIDGKNTMTIKYRYKLSDEDYTSFVTIPNNETQTLSLDKSKIYIFNVVVTDVFGAVFSSTYTLNKGVFPLFIDINKNSVGINEFPAEGEAFRVAGGIAHFEDGAEISNEVIGDFVVEQGTSNLGGVNWTYQKWHSGHISLEGVKYSTSAQANTLIEAPLYLPFTVSNVKPYVTCLAGGWALSIPPYFNINSDNDQADVLTLYYQTRDSVSRTYYFAIQVKGTWR